MVFTEIGALDLWKLKVGKNILGYVLEDMATRCCSSWYRRSRLASHLGRERVQELSDVPLSPVQYANHFLWIRRFECVFLLRFGYVELL